MSTTRLPQGAAWDAAGSAPPDQRGPPPTDAGWYWLSFADDDPPEGRGFLGVAIVWAASFEAAVWTSHINGLNPGGEVRGFLLDPACLPPPSLRERLLTREELDASGWGVSTWT